MAFVGSPASTTRSRAAGGSPWFVYVARCRDATIYVGIARDVAARIAAHDAGRGAKYTRGRAPLEVLATRRCNDLSAALRLERALKRLPRARKIALAASPHQLAAFARSHARRRAPAAR
jgi:putative endonuclease